VDHYYRDRFAQFEEKRRKEKERMENKAAKKDNKRKLSQTTHSMSSILEDKKSIYMDSVIDRNSTGTGSRRALVSQFSTKSSIPDSAPVGVQYSRTELLTLATSPLSRGAPLHWEKLLPKLPSVILQKSPRPNPVAVGGDLGTYLSETKVVVHRNIGR